MTIKVALAGATGNLGPAVLKALLDAGFEVTILSRKESKSTNSIPAHANQKIVRVDYTDVHDLTSALTGIHTVVTTLAYDGTSTAKPLIEAAIAAKVHRFLPSEFGADLSNSINQSLPIFKGKIETREYIESIAASNPAFTYTYLIDNAFFDWGLKVGFIANPKNHTAILYDGGDAKFSVTTLATVGKAVVGIIKNLNATKNRSVYVHDTAISVNDIIKITKGIDGREWSTEIKDTEEIAKSSHEEFKKSNPDVMKATFGFLYRACFRKDHSPDFSGKLDNELLGLGQFSPEQVKEVVKAAL